MTTISRFAFLLIAALAASGALVACGGGGGDSDGELYYSGLESAALGSETNMATCATCHSNDGTQAGYSGNSLKDIAYRASYKGGGAATLRDAVNACVVGWMGGTALEAQDEAYLMLEEYLKSISSPDVTAPNPLEPEVLDDEAAYEIAYAGGDPAAGAALYRQACGVCHDGLVYVNSSFAPGHIWVYTVGRIAQQVRTAGPPPSGNLDAGDSTPGPMPFFEIKDLSQQDLADIIAYVKARP
jgi:mono/diheme cytochrome c family protein